MEIWRSGSTELRSNKHPERNSCGPCACGSLPLPVVFSTQLSDGVICYLPLHLLGSVVCFVSFLFSLPSHQCPPLHWWREIFLWSLTREIFAYSHASVWGRTVGFACSQPPSLLCKPRAGLLAFVFPCRREGGLLSSGVEQCRGLCQGRCDSALQPHTRPKLSPGRGEAYGEGLWLALTTCSTVLGGFSFYHHLVKLRELLS